MTNIKALFTLIISLVALFLTPLNHASMSSHSQNLASSSKNVNVAICALRKNAIPQNSCLVWLVISQESASDVGVNWYSYTDNPIMETDPTGYFFTAFAIGAGIATLIDIGITKYRGEEITAGRVGRSILFGGLSGGIGSALAGTAVAGAAIGGITSGFLVRGAGVGIISNLPERGYDLSEGNITPGQFCLGVGIDGAFGAATFGASAKFTRGLNSLGQGSVRELNSMRSNISSANPKYNVLLDQLEQAKSSTLKQAEKTKMINGIQSEINALEAVPNAFQKKATAYTDKLDVVEGAFARIGIAGGLQAPKILAPKKKGQ